MITWPPVQLDKMQVASDPIGNIYIIDIYQNSTIFSNGQVISSPTGGFDYYLAKCNASGTVIWAKPFSSLSTNGSWNIISSFDILSNDNIAVTGQFSDGIAIGPDTLVAPLNQIMTYIALFDPPGNLIWINSDPIDDPVLIKADDVSGFYLTGSPMSTTSPFSISGLTFSTLPGYVAMYLIKYDNSGNPQWVKVINTHHLGGHCCQSIRGLVKGSGNDLYLAGFYFDEAVFDAILLPCYLGTGAMCSAYEFFVAKLGNIPTNLDFEKPGDLIAEIFPNPISEILHIELQSDLHSGNSLSLFDVTGRKVLSQDFDSNELNIEISDLTDGMYFVHITNGNKKHQIKIIKLSKF